ncbi:hypothetical protein C8Q70DRAFT_978218 [Cubamyces menziesii]|nr:hypothetical protein C8Q70DRAFT_978218 [Cubamyces menziesii]
MIAKYRIIPNLVILTLLASILYPLITTLYIDYIALQNSGQKCDVKEKKARCQLGRSDLDVCWCSLLFPVMKNALQDQG